MSKTHQIGCGHPGQTLIPKANSLGPSLVVKLTLRSFFHSTIILLFAVLLHLDFCQSPVIVVLGLSAYLSIIMCKYYSCNEVGKVGKIASGGHLEKLLF